MPAWQTRDIFTAMPPGIKRPKIAIVSGQRAIRVPRKKLTRLITFVAAKESTDVADVDVAIVSSREIAALNRRYLGHSGPTDVLSFDLTDPGDAGLSAQIVVCGDVAVKQAAARDIGPQHELMLYVLHGLLHLMGYDDETPRAAAKMRSRQEELLKAFAEKYRR